MSSHEAFSIHLSESEDTIQNVLSSEDISEVFFYHKRLHAVVLDPKRIRRETRTRRKQGKIRGRSLFSNLGGNAAFHRFGTNVTFRKTNITTPPSGKAFHEHNFQRDFRRKTKLKPV